MQVLAASLTFICLLGYLTLQVAAQEPNQGKTALDEYVWAPDNHYSWTELEQYQMRGHKLKDKDAGWTGYMLNMTSQQWLTPDQFSNTSDSGSIWWHILVVIVPDKVQYTSNASLYIT